MYIYQQQHWPAFTWDDRSLLSILSQVRNLQGRLTGKMQSLGFELRAEALLETLTMDVLKSTKIEGEDLNSDQVRSSIARRLGMDISGMVAADRNVEGVVEMMLDATQNHAEPLTAERLFNWHAALFPTGRSGMHRITVADWRKDETGPMQVVSGPMGKEKVHYQAPSAERLAAEMERFITWFNDDGETEAVLKSGLAHLWFITIHPFDDGNGRMARAIADMQLSKAEQTAQRFYSMSAQIEQKKQDYYNILEQTQKGPLDVTEWLLWYLQCMVNALNSTDETLLKVLAKARFWHAYAKVVLNNRQQKMLNRLMDDFQGKLTTSKWAKIAKCSQDTALRDIQDLMEKGILEKEVGGGRSTSYVISQV